MRHVSAVLPGPLNAVDLAAVERLLANGVAESRTLEYKRQLSDPKDRESKREFLADVTSFARFC